MLGSKQTVRLKGKKQGDYFRASSRIQDTQDGGLQQGAGLSDLISHYLYSSSTQARLLPRQSGRTPAQGLCWVSSILSGAVLPFSAR